MLEYCENLHMPARKAGLVSQMVPGTAVKGDKGSPHPPTHKRGAWTGWRDRAVWDEQITRKDLDQWPQSEVLRAC